MAAEALDLSVEELAARTGVSVRTIRWYQSEGLLPPPVRRGREARYGSEHVERLRLISLLQDRGLRLTAIREVLRHSPDEAAAADWLGLDETLRRPWTEDRPVLLDADELGARLGGTATDDFVEGLVAAGIVERRSDTVPVVYLVPSPGLLDVAVELTGLGVDLETAGHLRALLQDRLRAMADELVARFTEEFSLAHLADGGPGALAQLLDDLRPLTRRSVDLLFAHEMERAQRELLDAATAATAASTATAATTDHRGPTS